MNTTNIHNHTLPSPDEPFTYIINIIQGSIYLPIFCAGIGNNVLTILIILLNPDMRTVTNCYLLNLAISDILPLIVSLPFEISFLPIEVPWGHLGCRIRALLAETSTNASILTISAFTVERYLAVCGPYRISSLSTIRRAIKVQIFIWFISILSSTPYFFLIRKIDHQCFFDEHFQFFVTLCFHISSICFFLLPAFILCLLYALMARKLYNVAVLRGVHFTKSGTTDRNCFPMNASHKASIDYRLDRRRFRSSHYSLSRTLTFTRQNTLRHENSSQSGLVLHIQAMKKSAFKMLFAVVIAFIICYAPFHVQRLITSRLNAAHGSLVKRRTIAIFYFISGIFYYIGSTVNPIFYHLFSRKYRLAFNRTMKRLFKCKNRHKEFREPKPKPGSLLKHNPNTMPRIAKRTGPPIYRSHTTRVKAHGDRRNLLRISSSPYIHERIH